MLIDEVSASGPPGVAQRSLDVAEALPVRAAAGAKAGAAVRPMRRLWQIDGRTYDLTGFLGKHPGGRAALGFGKGGDCTELFHSYHLLRQPPAALMARFEITGDALLAGDIEPAERSHFTFAEEAFYGTLKKRVRAYFLDGKKGTAASPGWQAVALLMIAGAVALIYPAFVMGSLAAAVAHGLMRAMASIGPGHSMSHFSLFPRGRWNTLVFRLLSPFLISNPAIWTTAHVVSHHVDTLTPIDLQDNYPLKRIQPALRHRAWHRGQHLYIWPVYMLGLPLWSLQDLVLAAVSLFTGKHDARPFSLAQRIENTVVIAFNLFFTVALPFLFLPAGRALAVCLISNVISSLILVVQIAVNHEVPEAMGKVEAGRSIDWGVHQVLTSHNFAVDSALSLHFAGGLNMQIEHHLFPGVHYTHFPALSRIVRGACAEFGLPYHVSESLFEAVSKHYAILRTNSVP